MSDAGNHHHHHHQLLLVVTLFLTTTTRRVWQTQAVDQTHHRLLLLLHAAITTPAAYMTSVDRLQQLQLLSPSLQAVITTNLPNLYIIPSCILITAKSLKPVVVVALQLRIFVSMLVIVFLLLL
jgi:hypothetical protein